MHYALFKLIYFLLTMNDLTKENILTVFYSQVIKIFISLKLCNNKLVYLIIIIS